MQSQASKRHPTKYPGVYYREGKKGRTYMFVFRDASGKQHWQSVEGGLGEARDECEAMRTRLRGGEPVRRSGKANEKFSALASEWLVSIKSKVRERTLEDYKLKVARVEPYIGSIPMGKLSEGDIARLVAKLSEHYAPATVRNTLVPVSRVCAYARKHGAASVNVVRLLDDEDRPKGGAKRKKRILKPAEIQPLIAATTETYRSVIATAVYTGLRQMECLGLKWADIDFQHGYVQVREQLSRSGGRVALKTEEAERPVILDDALGKYLREHKAASRFSSDEDYVFCTVTGRPFGWSNVDRELKAACKRARLRAPYPTFHDLRHTFASLLIDGGASVSHVSRQLGHADVETTLRVYTHEFNKAANEEGSRAALSAVVGNSLVTSAPKSEKAPVVDMSSFQGKSKRAQV